MLATRKSLARCLAVAGTLAVCALVAPTALAFHKHLTPEQVREAYFIGRDQNHRDAFFAAYTHAPQQPNSGPNVQSIEFWTPYQQVALRARNAGFDYFPPDAEEDYLVNPIHEVIVRVLIFETYTFSFPSVEDPARVFKYRVSQNGHEVKYDDLTAQGTFSIPAGSGLPSFAGLDFTCTSTSPGSSLLAQSPSRSPRPAARRTPRRSTSPVCNNLA